MKRELIRIAIFVAVFFATAFVRFHLESWLDTFERDEVGWLSLNSYHLLLAAAPFVIVFFLGGFVLGLVAGTPRMAVFWGMLLGGVFIFIYFSPSGVHAIHTIGTKPLSLWQVILSWANLWAPLAVSVGGAQFANYLLVRARSQHTT